MTIDAFLTFLARVYQHPLVLWVLGLLAANILVGIAEALYNKTFRLAALGDWLLNRALPYVIVAGALQLLLYVAIPTQQATVAALCTAVWGVVLATLMGHILASLGDMGFPIPSVLGDRPKVQASTHP